MLPIILQNKPWCLVFPLVAEECQFRYEKGGRAVLEATYVEGQLCIDAYFAGHEEPLSLVADTAPGDSIRFVYYPWRMELYVNDTIVDEEWPYGDPLLAEGTLVHCADALSLEPVPEKEAEPDVLGSFTNAEGWKPGHGVFVGDCMPYSDGERYHVLYLKDRHHHHSKWGKGAHQWEHLSTADLVHWDIHPMVVAIDDTMEGSICTGSWIPRNGKQYLYYTVRMSDGSAAPIRRSVSADGFHYTKDKDFGFTLSARYTGASARDPKVVEGADGLLHMFVTTTLVKEGRGCLAHLTSADGESWSEQEPIYVAPEDSGEPECSDYFVCRGKYYLVFSLRGMGQYRVSDKPFTDWQTPADPKIPCHSVPKAAVWQDRVLFTGFKPEGGYAGTLTFLEAIPDENGVFSYKTGVVAGN